MGIRKGWGKSWSARACSRRDPERLAARPHGTTNPRTWRADIGPSRPGRVDQAIEYPLPDGECRRRLIELYGRGLGLALGDWDGIVARTEGASPAFIQEMLRKAALLAAEEQEGDGALRVTDEHCLGALRELLLSGGDLTRRLLGFAPES